VRLSYLPMLADLVFGPTVLVSSECSIYIISCTVTSSTATDVHAFTSASHPVELLTQFSTSLLSCSVSALFQGPVPRNNITAVTQASVCLFGGVTSQFINSKLSLELNAYFPKSSWGCSVAVCMVSVHEVSMWWQSTLCHG